MKLEGKLKDSSNYNKRATSANTYPKVAAQWLDQAFVLLSKFVPS